MPSRPVAAASKPKAKATAATRSDRAAARKRTPKATTATGGAKTTSRSRRPAAAPGQREQDVLRLVSERPGITVVELAEELSVDATGLYGVVRRLQAKGQIDKDGTALRPVTDTASTQAAVTPSEPAAPAPSTPAESPSEPPATDS
jgi:hypothetical protein